MDDNPVKFSVFAQIFDVPFPDFSALDHFPHSFKCRFWHIRMAQKTVRLPDSFDCRISGHFREFAIDVRNDPFGIGFGDQTASVK
jgi:hypothetical protein